MSDRELLKELHSKGTKGAPPREPRERTPADNPCLIPGCQRSDLPAGYRRCIEHRGGIPYDKPLTLEQYLRYSFPEGQLDLF